jgi:hypothetical protein
MSATITFRIPFDTCPCRFERRRRPPEAQPSSRHSYFKLEVLFLMKKFLFIAFISIVALNTACPTATAPSGNSNSASNANSTTPANIPPEFSTSPVTPSGNSTPGIPAPNSANLSNVTKGTTPTPGIPDPKELNKPRKPGATPTPGIPDPKTLKEQMNKTLGNKNIVNELPKDQKDLEKKVNDTLKTVRKPN